VFNINALDAKIANCAKALDLNAYYDVAWVRTPTTNSSVQGNLTLQS